MKALLHATVMHHRLRPRAHRFLYPAAYLYFPLSQMAGLGSRLLGVNRFRLFSIYNSNHGPRDGGELLPWIRNLLAEHGITEADGEVLLLAHPRLLGYVFNPVAFWFCLDRQGQLRAVLAEVSNTFGEHHNYLLAHPDQRPIQPEDVLTARKAFHVSPFLPVQGGYRFRFHHAAEKLGVWLDYDDADGPMLHTSLTGRLEALSDWVLWKLFLKMPLMTLGVVLRIHRQALTLLFKRARFHTKPAPPNHPTTRG